MWISDCGFVGILAGGGGVFVVVIGTVREYEESGSESSGSWMYSVLDWIGTLRSCEISRDLVRSGEVANEIS